MVEAVDHHFDPTRKRRLLLAAACAGRRWAVTSPQTCISETLEARQLLTTFYVDTNNAAASDSNRGTSISKPLKTIGQALTLSQNNNSTSQSDKILIRGGVYDEQPFVALGNSGASATNRTVISAYTNPTTGKFEPVYIDAADPTTGTWTQDGTSNIWYLSNFTTETSGVWVDWSVSNDGAGLQQIGGYGDPYFDNRTIIGSGESTMYPGTYYGDIADSRLYVWLADGSNPNNHVIEFANRGREIYQPGTYQNGGYVYANHVDFIGLNLRHDNVYDPNGQDVGCAIYTEGDERLMNCDIEWNAGVGVFLRGTSQMINCNCSNDGSNGVQAQGQGFLISGGQFNSNYLRQYNDAGEAGIKVITNSPVLWGSIINTEVANNLGKGIWYDTCFENSVVSDITGNYIHDNQGDGLDLEASRNYLVANNVIADNQGDGIQLNAVENATLDNNTIVGNYGIAAIELDGGTRDQAQEYPQYPGTTGMLNNSIDNNIIANNFTDYDLDVPTLAAGSSDVNNNTSDYNVFYRRGGPLHFTTGGTYVGWGTTPSTLADWLAASGQDAHSQVMDPLFIAGGSGASAYQIGNNSPTINAGANLSALFTTDFSGTARPMSGPFDIGAFEHNSSTIGTAGPVVINSDPTVWVDDQLPDNAAMTAPDESGNTGENQFWHWNSTTVFSEDAALDSGMLSGSHRQYFYGANSRYIAATDDLFAYVYIDPANPPQEIMLEWQDSSGSWDHLAYWGQNLINGAVDGSNDVHYIGTLPAAGQWTMLQVPASVVGLAGQNITGFSFDLYDGRALLDKIGNGPPTSGGTGTLSGTVFQDNNGDGQKESGETGIAGLTVFLDLNDDRSLDNGEPSETTDRNGDYSFTNLPAGEYEVAEQLPTGEVSTGNVSYVVAVNGGQTTIQDFGNVQYRYISQFNGDNFTVAQSDQSGFINIWENSSESTSPTYSLPASALNVLNFSTGVYQSTLTVDFSNGNPLDLFNISFDASDGSGTLLILAPPDQSNQFDVEQNYMSINNNFISYQNPTLVSVISGSGDDELMQGTGLVPTQFVGGGGNDTLDVFAGVYTFSGNPYPATTSLTVNVYDGAAVSFAAGSAGSGLNDFQLASLNLNDGAQARVDRSDRSADRSVLILSSLTFAGSSLAPMGQLDLSNNDLIVQNGDIAAVSSDLATGDDGGQWDGPDGIVSSAAQSDSTHLTALGCSPAFGTEFDGMNVSPTDVLVKYTYYGDTNLDGQVDGSDYSRLDFAELFPSSGWWNGDFNYDGMLNGSDFTLLDNTFNTQGASLAATIAPQTAKLSVAKPKADTLFVRRVRPIDPDVAATLTDGSFVADQSFWTTDKMKKPRTEVRGSNFEMLIDPINPDLVQPEA